ncbi:MAG: SRPBCC family protein [Bacteroidota bacterium]
MKKLKKYLLYSALPILVLAIIFFSAGIIFPIISYESKVTVKKPVEQSFRVFTDVFTFSEWIPRFITIKWLSGKQNEIGSKWEMTIEQEGKEYRMTETLIAFKENELFAFKLENDMLTNDVEIRFANKGETSEIISSNHITGKNIFWKSLFVFSPSYFKQQSKEMYDTLKKVIEKSN